VQVSVQGNDVDKALRLLKRKLQTEGFLKKNKKRKHYEKPSVKKKRKQMEAERKRRKAQRFRKPDRD